MDSFRTLQIPNLPPGRNGVASPLIQRIMETVVELVSQASLETLQEAVAAPTGAGSMATLVSNARQLSSGISQADPEAAALMRGAREKQRLLESSEFLNTAKVSKLLGISAAAVRKRIEANGVFAIQHAKDWLYPVWQFEHGEVLEGLKPVLQSMKVRSRWVQLDLLTTPLRDYSGETVIDLLKMGRTEEAVGIVQTYGEQGA